MNWEALGALAELAGAIGVILSLLYLAKQIGQNTRSLRASAYHSIAIRGAEGNRQYLGDEELRQIAAKGRENPASFTPDEQSRFNLTELTHFRFFESVFYQYNLGMLDDSHWKGYEELLRHRLRSRGAQLWWQDGKRFFSEEFAALVSSIIPSRGNGDA